MYNSLLAFTLETNYRGQAKVSQLHLQVVIEEEIAQFEISVDDVAFMQILHTQQQLVHVESCFWLSQFLAPPLQLHHRLKYT